MVLDRPCQILMVRNQLTVGTGLARTYSTLLAGLLSGLSALIALVLAGIFSLNGWAEEASSISLGRLEFHIPAQSLDRALQAWSKISGVDVLYESRIAADLVSSPVEGTFTRQSALEILLAGSELAVHYTRSDAITLSEVISEDAPPSSPLVDADLRLDSLHVGMGARPDERGMREFSETAQADIEAALRKNMHTGSGNYRAGVRLWVDPLRVIRRAELSQSSGDTARDTSIAETLRGLVLRKQPPENAPQPLRITINWRS